MSYFCSTEERLVLTFFVKPLFSNCLYPIKLIGKPIAAFFKDSLIDFCRSAKRISAAHPFIKSDDLDVLLRYIMFFLI